MPEDFDKTLDLIETICDITEDVEKDLEDGKISFTEGAGIALKYGVKAVKAISNIKEISAELSDIDSAEAGQAAEIVLARFGGSEEAKAAIKKMAEGAAALYEGAKVLIELRKEK